MILVVLNCRASHLDFWLRGCWKIPLMALGGSTMRRFTQRCARIPTGATGQGKPHFLFGYFSSNLCVSRVAPLPTRCLRGFRSPRQLLQLSHCLDPVEKNGIVGRYGSIKILDHFGLMRDRSSIDPWVLRISWAVTILPWRSQGVGSRQAYIHFSQWTYRLGECRYFVTSCSVCGTKSGNIDLDGDCYAWEHLCVCVDRDRRSESCSHWTLIIVRPTASRAVVPCIPTSCLAPLSRDICIHLST